MVSGYRSSRCGERPAGAETTAATGRTIPRMTKAAGDSTWSVIQRKFWPKKPVMKVSGRKTAATSGQALDDLVLTVGRGVVERLAQTLGLDADLGHPLRPSCAGRARPARPRRRGPRRPRAG